MLYKFTGIGRICADISVYEKCKKIRLAYNPYKGDTIFYNGIVFDDRFDKMIDTLKKGDLIYLEGKPKVNVYEGKGNQDIIVSYISIIQYKDKKEKQKEDGDIPIHERYKEEDGYTITTADDGNCKVYDGKGELVATEKNTKNNWQPSQGDVPF